MKQYRKPHQCDIENTICFDLKCFYDDENWFTFGAECVVEREYKSKQMHDFLAIIYKHKKQIYIHNTSICRGEVQQIDIQSFNNNRFTRNIFGRL